MEGVEAWNAWRDSAGYEIEPDLNEAQLRGAHLPGAALTMARLNGADLSAVNLLDADLEAATFYNTDWTESHLDHANLSRVLVGNANFTAAAMTGCDLSGAFLQAVRFTGADLRRAIFRRSRLSNCEFWNTDLEQADFTNATCEGNAFTDVDLSRAVGLDTVKHLGPSSIGIDTLIRSRGEIPEVFLREAGVPPDLIVYSRGLIGKSNQFYSVFISYSSKDERLATRLRADLRARDVRCWFGPEDIRIGDRFRQRIEEAIRKHDKLLLVLSESSIASSWVESEVEAALEKEQKTGKLVLFPIRLDDAVMKSTAAWAADIRRKRHIGEFQGWEHAHVYERAFARLLRDLGVEGA
jgi:hypothetical protein